MANGKLGLSKLIIFLIFYVGNIEGAPFRDFLISIDPEEIVSEITYVNAIYLLNLDSRTDRLAYMNDIFKKYEIQAIRVSAIKGSSIPENVIRDLTGRYYTKNLFQRYKSRDLHAAIGCLLGHLSILQNAFEKNFQIIWVLEDDIKVVGDISQIPGLLCKLFDLDPDWDIFYTDVPKRADVICPPHFPPLYSNKDSQKEKIGDYFNLIRWRHGTYSMIISRKGIIKILNYFQNFDIYGPIDNDLHFIRGIREYSVQADIVTHADLFQSDIECIKN